MPMTAVLLGEGELCLRGQPSKSSSSRPSSHTLTHFPPDVYPQLATQKEDELTSEHVKQGFTQSHCALAEKHEYANAAHDLVKTSQVASSFKALEAAKTALIASSLPSDAGLTSRKRPYVNTKEHFFLVTAKNKLAVDNWLHDLAQNAKPLSTLSKKVPVFNKKEDVLMGLCEHRVSFDNAAWFIKITAAYMLAMSESNKSKKRQWSDPALEWTQSLIHFLKEQTEAINQVINSHLANQEDGHNLQLVLQQQVCYQRYTYITELVEHMFNQHLLDRQEWVQYVVECIERSKYPDEPLMRLYLPQALKYIGEVVQSELLSRRLAHTCAKKITYLANDTDTAHGMEASATARGPLLVQAFQELMNDSGLRFIILGLSNVIHAITLECPSALVWHPFREVSNGKQGALLGSPLDLLPSCTPSGLPLVNRQSALARHQLKMAETAIRQRSLAVDAKWGVGKMSGCLNELGSVLSLVDLLDTHTYDRSGSSEMLLADSMMETLYSRIFGKSGILSSDDDNALNTVVQTLCDWAISEQRSGEHRVFIVARLLERYQVETLSYRQEDDDHNQQCVESNGSQLQQHLLQSNLFTYLDACAPMEDQSEEFANLMLLFCELIAHDVFSHDQYLCTLISRGELDKGVIIKEQSDDHNDSNNSFEDTKINDEISSIVNQIKEGNQLQAFDSEPEHEKQTAVTSSASPKGKPTVPKLSRHWQICYHLPLPPASSMTEEAVAALQHDTSQRNVLLYGAGSKLMAQCSSSLLSAKSVKRIHKDITRLFSKKNNIDAATGKALAHHKKGKSEVRTEEGATNESLAKILERFLELPYFERHSLTHTCSQMVLEKLSSFTSGSDNLLPVMEYVSLLLDLMKHARNMSGLQELSLNILKELPLIEDKLKEQNSSIRRSYTTTLGLYITANLRQYHSVFLLNSSDVTLAFENLTRLLSKSGCYFLLAEDSSSKLGSLSNLECTSAEWCILAYLYDLSSTCSNILPSRSREKFLELKRFFAVQPPTSSEPRTITDKKFALDYIANPRKAIDPLLTKLLLEEPQHQYNLVRNVLVEVCGCRDLDKLYDLALLCCEFTARCNALAQEWMGAFADLCNNSNGVSGYNELLKDVRMEDKQVFTRLGLFVSVLVARHCIPLQTFAIKVAITPLLVAWEEQVSNGKMSHETESVARISGHLLHQLLLASQIGSCDSDVMHASAWIKQSCDRQLLSCARKTLSVGAITAVFKALMVLEDATAKKEDESEEEDSREKDLKSSQKELDSDISAFVRYILAEISCQNWIRDRCFEDSEDLLRYGHLLDAILSIDQAQRVLRLIGYGRQGKGCNKRRMSNPSTLVKDVFEKLDEWNVRMASIEIRLIYHQLSNAQKHGTLSSQQPSIGRWLDEVADTIVSMFRLSNDLNQSCLQSSSSSSSRLRYPSMTFMPHLVRHFAFLHGRVLKAATQALDNGNWSGLHDRQGKTKKNVLDDEGLRHQAFLQLVLVCIEPESNSNSEQKDNSKKDRNIDNSNKEEQKTLLLQSLHTQLSSYLFFNKRDKIYDYTDCTARKHLLHALALRIRLVGGLFDTIYKNASAIQDWSTLWVQLISRGVISLENNSALFPTLIDMLAILIHATLILERESSTGTTDTSDMSTSSNIKRSNMYTSLVKKLRKETANCASQSTVFIHQLLPLSRSHLSAIVCEPFGTVTDAKGGKSRGFNFGKKPGFQMADKQKINPWDILEDHKGPAPLSWQWFGAVKHAKRPCRYESSFYELKFATLALERPASYYLEAPPLPKEDLQESASVNKESKDESQANPGIVNMLETNQGILSGNMVMANNTSMMAGKPLGMMNTVPSNNPMMNNNGQMMQPSHMSSMMAMGNFGGNFGPPMAANPRMYNMMQQSYQQSMAMRARMPRDIMHPQAMGPGVMNQASTIRANTNNNNTRGPQPMYRAPSSNSAMWNQQQQPVMTNMAGNMANASNNFMMSNTQGSSSMPMSVQNRMPMMSHNSTTNSKLALQNMLRARHPSPRTTLSQYQQQPQQQQQQQSQMARAMSFQQQQAANNRLPLQSQSQGSQFAGNQANNSGYSMTSGASSTQQSQQQAQGQQYGGYRTPMMRASNSMSGFQSRPNRSGFGMQTQSGYMPTPNVTMGSYARQNMQGNQQHLVQQQQQQQMANQSQLLSQLQRPSMQNSQQQQQQYQGGQF